MANKNFDESVLRDIIKKAINHGKLFELLFTDEGKRLWETWGEKRVKEMIQKELRKRH